jgi:methionyl aminopeptidase
MIDLKSDKEIEKIRQAGIVVAEILQNLKDKISPGVTTLELDQLAAELMRQKRVRSADLGYHGYPAHICVSLNEEVVHGIPSDRRIIRDGDLVSVDVTIEKEGFYADSALTVIAGVGDVPEPIRKLVQVTEKSLDCGIAQAVIGNRIGDISNAVQTYVEKNGFSVIREFIGHGIGRTMHEEPPVPNYGNPGKGPRLLEGMVLAIEPMVGMGRPEVNILDDDWTVVMQDGKPSAHFEHTVAITKKGPIVLTRPV